VAFATQAGDLVARIQEIAEHHHVAKVSDLLRIPVAERAFGWLAAYVPLTADQVQAWLVQNGRSLLMTLMGVSGAAVASVLGAVAGLALMLFLLFFLLRDGEELMRRAMRLVPMAEDRKAALLDHLSSVTRALVLGMLLTAVTQGALLGIGFTIVGLPSPVVFGVLTALASAVPLVGTALVWVPAVLVLLAQGRTWAALFLAVWSLDLVTSVDNVIRPLVVSGRAGLPTLAVFVGLVGGLAAFGAIGMFLGPVIVALAIALLRFAEESRAPDTRTRRDDGPRLGCARTVTGPRPHRGVIGVPLGAVTPLAGWIAVTRPAGRDLADWSARSSSWPARSSSCTASGGSASMLSGPPRGARVSHRDGIPGPLGAGPGASSRTA
jgi:predicted PurR-regulated permease PerM